MTGGYGQLSHNSSSDDGDGDEQHQEFTPGFAGDEQYSLLYSPTSGLGLLGGTNRSVSEQTASPSSNHRHLLSSRQRRPSSSRTPSPLPICEQDGSGGCSTGLGGLDGCCCCCCCSSSWRARGSSYSDWLPQFALDENDDGDDDDGDESNTPLTSPRSTKGRRTSSPTRRSPVVAVPVPVIDAVWLPNNAPTLERRLDALCEDRQRILGAERTARARLQQLLGLGPAPAPGEVRVWAGNAAQLRNWGVLFGRQIQETAMAIKRAGGMWA